MATYTNESIELSRKNNFDNDIVFIDGQGRSGKNLIALILSTMSRFEKMNLTSQLDYIARYYNLNKLTYDAAVVAIRILMDERYVYSAIARDTNFRVSDYSSVWKQGKRLTYFVRLFKRNEEKLIENFIKRNVIYQDMTHDGIQGASIYFAALGDRLKMIHVLRDPVENIFEQNKKNFGSRIGSDPREFQLSFKTKHEDVSLMALGHEDIYRKGNSLEKLIISVNNMFRLNIASYENLDTKLKKNIYLLDFESFVQNPQKDLEKIKNFVCDEYGKSLKRILKRERVPRIIEANSRKIKSEEITSNCRPKYSEIFNRLIYDYDDFIKRELGEK